MRTLIYQHSTCITYSNQRFLINFFPALLFGDEFPQHSQQAGIIDPSVDVAAVIRGKFLSSYITLHVIRVLF